MRSEPLENHRLPHRKCSLRRMAVRTIYAGIGCALRKAGLLKAVCG